MKLFNQLTHTPDSGEGEGSGEANRPTFVNVVQWFCLLREYYGEAMSFVRFVCVRCRGDGAAVRLVNRSKQSHNNTTGRGRRDGRVWGRRGVAW